jgi:dCMP deaminase
MVDRILPIPDWDCQHMSEAYLAARKSKDIRTQVGAVIVAPGVDHDDRTRGYNGPLRGLDDDQDYIYEKPPEGGPSIFMECAERNAITNAARIGVSIKGGTIYSTLSPCAACARAIVNGGLVEVVLHAEAPQKLNKVQEIGRRVLRAGHVNVRLWSGVPLIDKVLYDGQVILTGENNADR